MDNNYTTEEKKRPIFRDLNADDPDPEATIIESLCMNCHADGSTRLLLTRIPHYREVVIMSFSCERCGYQNNEIQSGGQVAEKGIRLKLSVEKTDDLNRQVVKSDFTSVKIVELDFEIPAKSQKGEVTTVEGIIDRSVQGLEQDQVLRRIQHPEAAQQIDEFVARLKALKMLETHFTLILEDITGNSFIENPNAPYKDASCVAEYFIREKEQNHELGLYTDEEIGDSDVQKDAILHPIKEDEFPLEDLQGEVMQFQTNCNNCGAPCETNMKMTNIPHFKEVVIMATVCETCGNRTNEVKSGGGIEAKGLRIEIDVKSKDDFSRDLLKSETCSLSIPQLDLEVGSYALGGRFTTVEGLLVAVRDQLSDSRHSHMIGDSQDPEKRDQMAKFMARFQKVLDGEDECTLVLDDPAGNSYIQSLDDVDDTKPDDRLRIVHYERSHDQNEELGLNDMKTENY
ncbi:PREDICTED: zinc finger protein ZPR1 [Nicrophorus vespilloides]|uniref:Zinc finger protein ZPR1 n=1 Tax=Nicrophorus vespilloides TaxID=110193 RepID=A0ABM1M1T1_NICVS|nr:PREDICTED: zinc finger protein ZPR1 [Nicrophorus vespilloides]